MSALSNKINEENVIEGEVLSLNKQSVIGSKSQEFELFWPTKGKCKYDNISKFFNKSMAFIEEGISTPTLFDYCKYMNISRAVIEQYRRYSKAHFEVINMVVEFIESTYQKVLYESPAGASFYLTQLRPYVRKRKDKNDYTRPLEYDNNQYVSKNSFCDFEKESVTNKELINDDID